MKKKNPVDVMICRIFLSIVPVTLTNYCKLDLFNIHKINTFCLYAIYTEAVQLRAQSVLGQLDGEIPSAREGQSAEPDTLLDTGDADFSGLSGGMVTGWR